MSSHFAANCVSNRSKLIDRTAEQSDHPVLDLDRPIEDQVQLFAEDKVTIVGARDSVSEVWFGNDWEPFVPNKTYTVWGVKGEPLIPRFKGRGMLKLEVRFTRYRDRKRDLRPDADENGDPVPVAAS